MPPKHVARMGLELTENPYAANMRREKGATEI
jgi:hypothetical protein